MSKREDEQNAAAWKKLAEDQHEGECWQCYCGRKGLQHTNGPCRCTAERRKMKAHPTEGGCWYCHKKDENLVFCCEFDTNIHIECIKKQLRNIKEQNGRLDGETEIIAREFNLLPLKTVCWDTKKE